MATMASLQSGNWNTAATWGGAIPTITDDIVVSPGHTVTLTEDFIINGSVTLSGTLSVAAGVTLTIGTVTGNKIGRFVFAGGTLTGGGVVSPLYGYMRSEGDSWSFVSGDISIAANASSTLNGYCSYTLNRVSFTTDNALEFRTTKRGTAFEIDYTFTSCVFACPSNVSTHAVTFGAAAGSAQFTPYRLYNCEFRNWYEVAIRGATSGEDAGFEKVMDGCVFVGRNTTATRLNCQAVNDYKIHGCVLLNVQFVAANRNYDVCNCYAAKSVEGNVLSWTSENAFVRDSIIHQPNRDASNNHTLVAFNVNNCYLEAWGTGGPNIVMAPNNAGTCNWTFNIFKGHGQFATCTTRAEKDLYILNNTSISTGDQAMEMFMQETQEHVPLDRGIEMYRNLQVCTAASPKTNSYATTSGGLTIDVHLNADWNARYNVTGPWWTNYITNDSQGLNNIEGIDPQFVDASREIEAWGKLITGNPAADYAAVWDILTKKNGFVSGQNIQDVTAIPPKGFEDLLTWLRAGFAPRNEALALPGGTFFGAVPLSSGGEDPEPKPAPIVTAPSSVAGDKNATGYWSVDFNGSSGTVTWEDPNGVTRQLGQTCTLSGWSVSVYANGTITASRSVDTDVAGTIILNAVNEEGVHTSRQVTIRLRSSSMTTVQIGKVRPTFEGEWNPSRNYEAMVIVTIDGDSYQTVMDAPAGADPRNTNSTYWFPLGRKGSKGDPGDPGARGIQGLPGPPSPQPPISDSLTSPDSGTYASSMAAYRLNNRVSEHTAGIAQAQDAATAAHAAADAAQALAELAYTARVVPDGVSIIVNAEGVISVSSAALQMWKPGDMRLSPFSGADVPAGWYAAYGARYALTSPQGIVLNSLSATYKAQWNITISGNTINVPNLLAADGRGPFLRIGTPGQTGTDTMRPITASTGASGAARGWQTFSGAFYGAAHGNKMDIESGNTGYNLGFNSALLGGNYNGGETAPLYVRMSGIVFLGV